MFFKVLGLIGKLRELGFRCGSSFSRLLRVNVHWAYSDSSVGKCPLNGRPLLTEIFGVGP